jgi:hypothetical protein
MTRLEIMIARPRQGRIPELWRKQYYSANLRSTVPRITIHAYMKREIVDKQLTIPLAELSDYLPYIFSQSLHTQPVQVFGCFNIRSFQAARAVERDDDAERVSQNRSLDLIVVVATRGRPRFGDEIDRLKLHKED